MKGSSSWLTSLPLKEENYTLNKREFYDAVSLRYRWTLKNLPLSCACGKQFEPDHALSCMKGGYIHRRHDNIRDIIAKVLDEVAYDVEIEPNLQPLTGEQLRTTANREDEARLDVAARGFWQRYEKAFFDIRVFNPFARSHLASSLEAVFRNNENQKKRAYNDRVIQIEHGTFTPLVFSAFGGCSHETTQFLKRLVEKVGERNDISSSIISNYIRTKISFELVRSQVMCIRGSRSLRKIKVDMSEVEVHTTNIRE